jgi:hypothetical protein
VRRDLVGDQRGNIEDAHYVNLGILWFFARVCERERRERSVEERHLF